MRLISLSLAAALVSSGCTQQTPSEPAAEPAPADASTLAPTQAADGPATPAPADACGAADHQDWVGKPRADVPSAPAGKNWRVFETGQPVTQDLRPDRLNIEIDPTTQKVARLSCG